MGRRAIDLTGQRFGRWTVLYRNGSDSQRNAMWYCRCDCGKEKNVSGKMLRSGISQSCGCLKHERIIESNIERGKKVKVGDKYGALIIKEVKPLKLLCECDCGTTRWFNKNDVINGHIKTCGCGIGLINPAYIDETGNRYGHLTVIKEAGRNKEGRVMWECLCDCGNTKITLGKSLRAGLVQSCGCIHSTGEQKINNILSILNINFISQKSFQDLRNDSNNLLFVDFYLPDYNVIIEYQGKQHYTYKNGKGWNNKQNFMKTQKHDNIKRQYCLKHNIRLIEIPYTDFDKINEKYILYLLEGNNESGYY